jgi:hypothetical protein
MAIRYCKNVKITCTLTPDGEQQKCVISLGGKRLGVQHVRLPMHLTYASDSPIAYDKAAHAALSFAVDEEERGERSYGDLASHLEYTDSGYAIRRQKAYRHNVGPRGGGSYR